MSGQGDPVGIEAGEDDGIKRIPVEALRVGMFVNDLACDWMSHPFLRNKFLLKSLDQIARIRDAGIAHVFIDVRQGADVATSVTAGGEAKNDAATERTAPAAPPPKITVAEELTRAKNVHAEATRFVKSFMQDARLGKTPDVEEAAALVERTTDSVLRNAGALLSLCQVRDKDQYTFLHSVSVCALMIAFGRSLGFTREDLHQLGLGGLMHDLGKAFVPDAILNKPGKLTDEEFAIIKRHPADGHKMLLEISGIGATPLAIVIQHHERIDGRGYPHGLAGDALERIGRMGAICDIYDAITADRAYHRAIPPTRALRNMLEWSGNHLDRGLVQTFIRTIGIYPVGSLVRLESAKLAVVLEQSDADLLTPVVRVVFNARTNLYVTPEDLDLARSADRIVNYEDPVRWSIDTKRFM